MPAHASSALPGAIQFTPRNRSWTIARRRWRLGWGLVGMVLAWQTTTARGQEPEPAAGPPAPPAAATANPFKNRIPAPSLDGGTEWLNVAGPLELRDLRGKFVLLDFWTYCCINCMHVLPELKKLEQKYAKNLVVIGVHSAKFTTEKDSKNIAEAIERYEIEHPVVNDANHVIWNAYEVSSWPSLRLIDPEGNLVGVHSGEIEFEALDPVMAAAVEYYRSKGLLDEKLVRFDLEKYKARATPLRFPGKLLADEAQNRLFISDSNNNRIVIATLDGQLVDVIGSGAIGAADGSYAECEFNHPQGMALQGETLYVADNENHLLRKVDLAKKTVKTIAGTGRQSRFPWPGVNQDDPEASLPRHFTGPPLETALSSPWDLWIHKDVLYIAMAGPHQIWKMPLDESEIGIYAGNGREDIVDGRLAPRRPYGTPSSSFAQPSGLASDGTHLFVADSEGSSIRSVPFSPSGDVKTIVGTAHLPYNRLFTFGDMDGKGNEVLLQHALGLVYYRDALYIADTYNNKIKQLDPQKKSVKTLAGDGQAGAENDPARFDEPSGLAAAGGKLYVADTNNHQVRTIDLDANQRVATLEIRGLKPPQPPKPTVEEGARTFAGARQVELPQATVKPQGKSVKLAVKLELPEGYKINPGAPMAYRIEATGDSGPVDRGEIGKKVVIDAPSASPEIEVPLAAGTGSDTVRVSLVYYYCQDKKEGLCLAGSVAWTLPLEISPTAASSTISLPYTVE